MTIFILEQIVISSQYCKILTFLPEIAKSLTGQAEPFHCNLYQKVESTPTTST